MGERTLDVALTTARVRQTERKKEDTLPESGSVRRGCGIAKTANITTLVT